MFSTIPNTIVTAEAIVDAGREGVARLRFDVDTSASKMCSVPTEGNLRAWARGLYLGEWDQCDQAIHRRSPHSRQPPLTLLSVTVSSLRIAFDCRTGAYTAAAQATIIVLPDDVR